MSQLEFNDRHCSRVHDIWIELVVSLAYHKDWKQGKQLVQLCPKDKDFNKSFNTQWRTSNIFLIIIWLAGFDFVQSQWAISPGSDLYAQLRYLSQRFESNIFPKCHNILLKISCLQSVTVQKMISNCNLTHFCCPNSVLCLLTFTDLSHLFLFIPNFSFSLSFLSFRLSE